MKKSTHEYRNLAALFHDAKWIELRAIKKGRPPRWSWHNDPDSLLGDAGKLSGEGVLLCTTMAEPRSEARMYSLSDAGVVNHRRLLFDFDRKEKSDTNATDDDLAEAEILRGQFVEYIRSLCWPEPALATSGNGLHAIYRVNLAPSLELGWSLGEMYRVLSDTFQSERFKLDTATRSAAQACRLYGTLNRKHPATKGRPQRLSSIVLPPDWLLTDFDPSWSILDAFPKPEINIVLNVPLSSKQGDWTTLDIVRWFQANGLYLKPLSTGKHAVSCPWQVRGDHEKTCYSDAVIWETSQSGYPSFFCSHDTCGGRGSLIDLNAVMGGIADFCG